MYPTVQKSTKTINWDELKATYSGSWGGFNDFSEWKASLTAVKSAEIPLKNLLPGLNSRLLRYGT
jgi:hypothetical protein